MEPFVEDFLLKFHSLEGTTIADRTRNFFMLLHQNASFLHENPQVLDAVTSNLIPSSYLESQFRLDFLIYFRRTQELLQVLQEGNDIFVSRITKHVWFFKDSFNDVPADKVVNEILPSMSYSIRMKILRKLSRYLSFEKFDEIFDAVVKRYGIFLASLFITGCGPDKVRAILSDYPIQLTSTQLIILHGRDRELIIFYFEKNYMRSTVYKDLVKFIYINDRSLFDYFKEKYNVSINLGRRLTKKFVVAKKEAIIQKPYDYKFLNMKAVLRKIGKDSLQLFINTLPKTIVGWNSDQWIIQSFPKKYHYSLYMKTIPTHYKIKYEDYYPLITSKLLWLIPDLSERSKLAKVKVDKGEDDFIKFLRIEESIPLIKEKINLTSDISERGNLVKMLLETCHINNDFGALFSVMKYFCFRHKNDDLQVHLKFIRDIESYFGFEKFTEEMWNCLNELLLIHMLKFDQSEQTYQKIQTLPLISFNKGTSRYQKLSYLQFLFKKGESIDELIKEYLTTNFDFPDYGKYDKNFGKYFLVFTINNVATESCKDEDIKFCIKLIEEISHWNKRYTNDQLSFYDFPVLHHAFRYSIEKSDPYRGSIEVEIFRSKIFTTKENIYKNEYLKIFWERFQNFLYFKDFRWFLQYDPLIIVKNFETVFSQLSVDGQVRSGRVRSRRVRSRRVFWKSTVEGHNLTAYLRMWHLIKKFTHLHLDEMAIEACLTKLNEENSVEKKSKLIPCLSVLMKPQVFAALADSYKPANKKLDLKNENEVRLYNLQCEIASHFKNTKSHEVLPSLLNYCVGDYLKNALRSLYSLLYRTPENMLPQYLNHLSKQAVSVRKHALFMACELCTTSKVEEMIRVLNKQEGVQSLQKHMFSTTIKYFVKNPSDQFFDLVKLNMIFISKSDDESLDTIVDQLQSIPSKYKSAYVIYSWEFLEKTVDVWEKLSPLKNRLLVHMTLDIVKNIPVETGIRIIQQHLMTKNDRDLSNINNLVFNLLIVKEERSIIFEKVFEIIDQCGNEGEIDKFFNSFYVTIMKWKQVLPLAPLVSYFEKRITLIEHFCSFVKIFFMKCKLEMREFDDFFKKIVTFFEEVIAVCGTSVIPLFAKEMQSNLLYFITSEITKYDVYYNLVKQRPVADVAILVLTVVSEPGDKDLCSLKRTFVQILRLIGSINDVGVKVNLLCRFRSSVKAHNILDG